MKSYAHALSYLLAEEMPVVIPTYKREDAQHAFMGLPASVQQGTTLVTHSGRADLLRRHNPTAKVLDLGVTDGIADVRQKILDQFGLVYDKIFIIDDRCRFMTSSVVDGKRKPAARSIRGEEADREWYTMLARVSQLLDAGYAQVGISARPGNNNHPASFNKPGRAYSVYGINMRTCEKAGVRFDGMYRKNKAIKLYEDFYFTLSLLTRAIPNIVWYDFCFQTDHGKPGGNNEIRTNELQRICAEALAAEFPNYVKVSKKPTKAFKLDGESHRWDVTVQWKKAYVEAGGVM